MNRPSNSHIDKVIPNRRPPAPPVRIDTCIVGDDTTCEIDKHEVCRTHLGVSSCDCKPGYGRVNHRKHAKKTIRLMMSLQVDRIKQKKIEWNSDYVNPNSQAYRVLEDESVYAIDTAMALTSLSNVYLSNDINKFFALNNKVTVNATLLFVENAYTSSVVVKRDVQKKLIEVIQARNNNIGNGNLYAQSQLNPILGVADVNECAEPELHDCDPNAARCINRFGTFDCRCLPGYGDAFADNPEKAGRFCQSCSADHCYGRGLCSIEEGDIKVCQCKGNYYGKQCEIDGEVVAVAVGASVAAVVIIMLTLTILCLWSRRWKREQQKAEIMRGFPPTYLNGPPAPNPHLAATYLANLNKAAAYAAAIQQNSTMPRHYSYQATSHEDLTAEGRMRVQPQPQPPPQTKDPYGHNIYAQLVPLGNGSQFQPRELFQGGHPPPPPNIPPPPVPEPLYAYPSSIYGTLPRGPPRPIDRPGLPTLFQVHQSEIAEAESEDDQSAIERQKRQQRLAVINYATFRQNISAEAAAAALRRAEITAHMARHWSDEDISQMPTMRLEDSLQVHSSLQNEAEGSLASTSGSNSEASQSTDEVVVHRRTASPSPSTSRRSRSTSPGKTVTFAGPKLELEQDERSLNELDASPRRMIHLKPLALAASNLIAVSKGQIVKAGSSAKRRAPSPPDLSDEDTNNDIKGLSNEVSLDLEDSSENSDEDLEEVGGQNGGHHE